VNTEARCWVKTCAFSALVRAHVCVINPYCFRSFSYRFRRMYVCAVVVTIPE
jgi:hypothetical protein